MLDPEQFDLMETFGDESLPLPARLDAVRSMLERLEESTSAVRQAIERVVTSTALDDELIATLYWEFDGVVPSQLLGHFHTIQEVILARCPWTYPCSSCGVDQAVTSRSMLRAMRKPPRRARDYAPPDLRCRSCRAAATAAQSAAFDEQQAAYRRRVQDLRRMPYREYLLTSEWQDRRKARLKAARYRCQVCNTAGTRLNVHHRTYERRGEEFAGDLIVLCEPCHHLFHRNGSLAPHDEVGT